MMRNKGMLFVNLNSNMIEMKVVVLERCKNEARPSKRDAKQESAFTKTFLNKTSADVSVYFSLIE